MIGKIIIGLFLVIVVIVSITFFVGDGSSPTTYTSPSDSATTSPTYTEPELPSQPTFSPIVITGTVDKTSPPFTITTDEWIIDWYYKVDSEWERLDVDAVFALRIYSREKGIRVESVDSFYGVTSGSTYSYAGAGEYYIKVTAAGTESWEVIIRPPE